MKRERTPRVAVLTYPSTAWGRRLIRGVVDYARHHGLWQLWTDARWTDASPRLPPGWRGDGIIARLSTHAVVRQVAKVGVPVVNVARVVLRGVTVPRVTDDVQESARLAIEHFLDRGFQHFAYCGQQRQSFVVNHCSAFTDALHALGYSAHVYQPNTRAGVNADWQTRQKHLAQWLLRLPKPVAVLTWTVPWGQQVIDACHAAKLLVPEQVAVLAGDDDDLMCEVCHPPLSGVAIAAEQIGREAASLLDRLMHRGRAPSEAVVVPPLQIVGRQSTDTLAINNPDLVAAVRFIRQHAADPIRVPDVLRGVPVSRSQLERQFASVLGRTPAAEIRRVHVQRASQLLAETNLSIPDVAVASGFNSPEYLTCVFKSSVGMSPLKFRNRVQRG